MSDPTPPAYASDLLARQPFSNELERFLLTEHHFVEGSLVVSLDAPFGSGKTTFIQMWASDLKERRKNDPTLPRPIIINAWESDYCGDPLVALISSLSRSLIDDTDPKPELENANKLREAAKDVAWFSLGLANSIFSKHVGVDPVAAAKLAETKRSERAKETKPPLDALTAYEDKTVALAKLKQELTSTFGEDEPSAVVIIDELDRCRPDYAISYLETIKHVLDVHGIVFVLSIDATQLQSAAEVLFGGQLNFTEYYRKFSHRTVQLPVPEKSEVWNLVHAYTKRYLKLESRRGCVIDIDRTLIERVTLLFLAWEARPRQIQEAFRILGHAFETKPGSTGRLPWAFSAAVLLMVVLRVKDRRAYNAIADGTLSPKQIEVFLKPLGGNQRVYEWWFKVIVVGLRLDSSWEAEVSQEMIRMGWLKLSPAEKPDLRIILGDFIQGWNIDYGYAETSGFTGVRNRIERLLNFAK